MRLVYSSELLLQISDLKSEISIKHCFEELVLFHTSFFYFYVTSFLASWLGVSLWEVIKTKVIKFYSLVGKQVSIFILYEAIECLNKYKQCILGTWVTESLIYA